MTSSALSQVGERERTSVKFAEIDWLLFTVVCLIGGAGIAMLYSIAGSSWHPWALNQVLRFGVGVALMLTLALISLRVWFFLAYPIYAVALALLAVVPVIGTVSHGGRRWLDIGPVQLQPSELMKIGLVLALARFYQGISAKEANFSWKLLIPAALIAVPAGLVEIEPDLGTCILLLLTGGAVVVLAGLSFRVLAAALVAGIASVPVIFEVGLQPYQRERIMTMFTGHDSDPHGAGFQIKQGIIAMGSGGVLGRGYGLGSQSQLSFVPEKHTDFIFATFAEEFGFVGCASILFLFALAIFISLRIAAVSHSHFGRLAAAGVTATFAAYLLINGAMVMGLAPVVGVPMPLMSYGGTVMLTVMVAFGLVQCVRVHRYDEVGSGRGSLF
ncbi:MAG: rod shape-determining protein RodA [Alphaproteobacteria bacterium]